MEQSTVISLIAIAVAAIGAVITYRIGKGANQVGQEANQIKRLDAAERRAEEAVHRADQAEERLDACQARLRAMEIRQVQQESRARLLEIRFASLIKLIHEPGTTIEQVRERVPADFPVAPD